MYRVEMFDKNGEGDFVIEGVRADSLQILPSGALFFSDLDDDGVPSVMVAAFGMDAWRAVWQDRNDD